MIDVLTRLRWVRESDTGDIVLAEWVYPSSYGFSPIQDFLQLANPSQFRVRVEEKLETEEAWREVGVLEEIDGRPIMLRHLQECLW